MTAITDILSMSKQVNEAAQRLLDASEPAPVEVRLPTEYGSGIFWNQGDAKGTRVAMRTGSYRGKLWHYLEPGANGTRELNDRQVRALVGNYPFTTIGITK